MKTSLSQQQLNDIYAKLKVANEITQGVFPGDSALRQPVHTVYGGAQLFKASSATKIGELARESFQKYLPDPAHLNEIFAFHNMELAAKVFARVKSKLEHEPLEDFRIDFEDGFGVRPDHEEDEAAVKTAVELAKALQEKIAPPYFGIRIKTFSEELKQRSIRTLDLFVTTLVEHYGRVPENFVVTLPKITNCEQVAALVEAFKGLERTLGLPDKSLKMEFMIETPQSIFDQKGHIALPYMVRAAEGRCIAAHFGTYDYTASMSVVADQQRMDHPACDFARSVMKVALSGTGIWLSDGATNVMPVEIYKNPQNDRERDENRSSVTHAWRLSYAHIQHSLTNGYYQGWDLHPAQLPVRYIALHAFFLRGFDTASQRLKNFIQVAAKATLVGDIFDDAATGQGLLNYFLRAINCGAATETDALSTGLSLDEIRLRSFKAILDARVKRS